MNRVPLVLSALLALTAISHGARADSIAIPPPAPPSAPGAPPLSAQDAAAIVTALREGARQGLAEPAVANAIDAISGADPAVRAAADSTLSEAAVRLAAQQHGLAIDPSSIDKDFALLAPYDAAADFATARRAGGLAAWAAALAPTDPAYQPLVAARARYAAIAAAGGWGAVADGKPLKLGAADARVPALRQRLAAEGFVADSGKKPSVFDAPLAAQLSAFQTAHGLTPDSKLDAATRAALNVPAAARLAAIDANLERERWLPRDLPADRIEVDTGGATATLFKAGEPVLVMRAVVGEPSKKTPTFASRVTGIVFNPPWNVPADIARSELYPKERRSRGYFARNGFHVADGQLIQRAGPKSALGRIKFEMPDPFTVYMHDTPDRALFKRDKRWLSHGCVRLEQPRELATALLAPQGWDSDQVEAAIAAGATHRVDLQVQPQVFVVYRTVVASADGRVTFRPDVYGWDAEIEAALAAK